MRPHHLAGSLLPLLLLGCSATSGEPSGAEASVAPVEPAAPAPEEEAPEPESESSARRRAISAIRSGEYAEAREILTALLLEDYLARATALFAEGNPQDGLMWTDRALELEPRDHEALVLRGEGSLLLAEELIAAGSSGVFVNGAFAAAPRTFQLAGDEPAALFGASRAAHGLDRPAEAVDLAERGLAALSARELAPGPVELRALSEATYLLYVRTRQEGGDDEAARETWDRSLEVTEDLLGRTPTDPWVWNQLSYLYQWEGDLTAAREVLEQGLDRVPDDPLLLARLVDVARVEGGGEGVVATLERFTSRHSGVAEGWQVLGVERFHMALAALLEGSGDEVAFQSAEHELARARDVEPERRETVIGYEVMCRNAAGWCRLNDERLAEAEAAFRSMEDLFEGGMTWEIEGSLLNGYRGLQFVANAYVERSDAYEGSDLVKPDWLARAARIFDDLGRWEPDSVQWANNAGLFHRDAAVEAELVARACCDGAAGTLEESADLADLRERAGIEAAEGSPEEAASLHALADRLLAEAQGHMRRSYSAYRRASSLAPDDVRVVNDTALIPIYHLYRDLDWAESELLRLVELGERQLESEELTEEERRDLMEAWGDVHQNLGVLNFHLKSDPEGARHWFERAVEIGPDPRPLVSDGYLPVIDAGPDGEPPTTMDSVVEDFGAWGAPCSG
jgi:tetratricopeptide (TPR) repeat protein